MNLTKLNKILPQDSFIYFWMKHQEYYTTPKLCDFWSGVYALSCILAHRVKIRDIYEDIHPNLMMFLLHEESINVTKQLMLQLESFINRYKYPEDIFINSRSDVMQIIMDLNELKKQNKHNTLLCTSTSIGAFFGNVKNFYYYQDLYNNPNERKGYGRTKYCFGPVFINCISAGSFMEYSQTVVGDKESDWTCGSNLLIPIRNVKKQCEDWVNNGHNPCYSNLIKEKAKEICKEKPYTLTIEYEASKFLNKLMRKQRLTDTRFSAYFANRRIFTVKFAGILAVNRGSRTIEIEDIKNGNYLYHQVLLDIKKYIEDLQNHTYLDELDKLIIFIQKTLLRQGDSGIKHSDLWQKMRQKTDINTYKTILKVMHELGIIDKYIVKRGRAVLYMANVNTRSFDYSDVVKQIKSLNNA